MSSQAFAEAAALQAASTALLTEIRDLTVRVSAVLPLVQEFRAATTRLVSPRPSNVGDHVIRCGTCPTSSTTLTVKVPE